MIETSKMLKQVKKAANINLPRYLPSREVDDDDYYITELGNVLHAFEHVENGFRGLISDMYICLYVYCDILSKHALFCRSCV